MSWPHLTVDVSAIACVFRAKPEDFEVEEIPAYAPSGSGEHLFLWIEKRGLGTHAAARRLATHFGISPESVGRAGMKDARSVSRQTLSVEGVDPTQAEGLELDGVRVLHAARHGRKLRVGHLRGNRFRIKIRRVPAGGLGRISEVLSVLETRGVPNYFGPQRFGARGDTWCVGRALLLDRPEEALSYLCGRPRPDETPRIARARGLFDEGRFSEASGLWPSDFAYCAAACRSLARGRPPDMALKSVGRSMRRFFVAAYQSRLFNALLGARINEIDRLRKGDLAMKHENGAVFLVEDPDAERDRAAALEISATGPLFGPRMTLPTDGVAVLENTAAAGSGGSPTDFSRGPLTRRLGGRRALRVPLGDHSVEPGEDRDGPFVVLGFDLPAGAYATSVLREVGKELLEDAGSLGFRTAGKGGAVTS